MIIALDCDEVLVDTGSTLRDVYKIEYPNDDINPHSYSSTWPAFKGNKELWKQWLVSRWENSEFFTSMKAMPGAVEAVVQLKKAGHKLFVVTAVSKHLSSRRREHLERLFGNVFEDIKLLGIGSDKRDAIINIKADILVDDDIKYLTECADVTKCIGFMSQTNSVILQQAKLLGNIKIANGWSEVINVINHPCHPEHIL